MTHWKRPWCWEGLGAGGEGDDRGWDGWDLPDPGIKPLSHPLAGRFFTIDPPGGSKDQNHQMQEIVQKVIRYQQAVVEVNTNMISPKKKKKFILKWDRVIYYTFDNNSIYQRKWGHSILRSFKRENEQSWRLKCNEHTKLNGDLVNVWVTTDFHFGQIVFLKWKTAVDRIKNQGKAEGFLFSLEKAQYFLKDRFNYNLQILICVCPMQSTQISYIVVEEGNNK